MILNHEDPNDGKGNPQIALICTDYGRGIFAVSPERNTQVQRASPLTKGGLKGIKRQTSLLPALICDLFFLNWF